VRVVLAVAWYFPEAVGGTEQYVRGLARQLAVNGVDVMVAVPSADVTAPRLAMVDGIPVRRFHVEQDEDPALRSDRQAPRAWRTLIDEFRPDVVDVHSLTTDLGLPHLRAARDINARTMLTLHLPGLVCARGTLMRFGETPCDGNLAVQPCTACRLQAQGVPSILGRALSLVPADFGRGVARAPVPRALQRPFTAALAHEDRVVLLRALSEASDAIVALSEWQADMLRLNGVPAEKIAVCRQGVESTGKSREPVARAADAPLRVGYVGRYDPAKGVHVLVDAALRLLMGPASLLGLGARHPVTSTTALRPASLELHLWGVARTPEARAYRDAIQRQCEGVPSITLHAEASSDSIYSQIDVLVVPSLAFETGPLVVLEAHAAGVPVVGSNLGGIAERVVHGVNGLLVPPDDAVALASALRSLIIDRAQLGRLTPRGPVRTMRDVAVETLDRYHQVLSAVSV
jgi:glycosyltransferase involved in cell wall biosynthesis